MEDCEKKYTTIRNKSSYTTLFPLQDLNAINEAYRLELASAAVRSATDTSLAYSTSNYIMNATSEEIWFWTSKLLGVLGNKIDKERVLNSLYVLSGGKKIF